MNIFLISKQSPAIRQFVRCVRPIAPSSNPTSSPRLKTTRAAKSKSQFRAGRVSSLQARRRNPHPSPTLSLSPFSLHFQINHRANPKQTLAPNLRSGQGPRHAPARPRRRRRRAPLRRRPLRAPRLRPGLRVPGARCPPEPHPLRGLALRYAC